MATKVPVKRGAHQPQLWSGGVLEPIEQLHREMDRIFDRFFDNFFDQDVIPSRLRRQPDVFAPRFEAWGDDDGYHVEVELPGVRQEDLDLSLSGSLLSIRGKKERGGKGKGDAETERWHQEFERVLTLPEGIEADRVEATLRDGLLHVILPKSEVVKPRRIAVKAE